MSCGEGYRHSSDSELLWLWHKLMATALIRPQAWEPPYATSSAALDLSFLFLSAECPLTNPLSSEKLELRKAVLF